MDIHVYQALQYRDDDDSNDMIKSTVILSSFLFKHAVGTIDYTFDAAFWTIISQCL
jgi:hypothetical protein